MYYMYIGFSNKWQTNQESGIFQYKNIFPQSTVLCMLKHLTFQFVLLELPNHLIYAPLPSTHQPRPTGEYKWQVCYLLDGLLLPLLHLSSLTEIGT